MPARNPAIRRLEPELIREIAAGEVIGAPADVLRELLENALDAGATRLELELDAGGKDRLRVVDNGVGIPATELELATLRHSTSKLRDLGAIDTLGFRGEGLAAIRHAARLEITSRPEDQLGGVRLVAQGEEFETYEQPAPAGTSAEATRLFERLPARRQALGSAAAEARTCQALAGRYLLHHPRLQVRLSVDGEVRWSHAGGGFADAAALVWGTVTANRLLPLQHEVGEVRLEGLIGRPELTRPRRDRLVLAVNGRPVEWPDALLKAALTGYRELLPAGRYPAGILNLELPPTRVLVNTAPDKRRVRLHGENELAGFVRQGVEAALAEHPLAPPLPVPAPPEGIQAAPRGTFPRLRHLGTYRDLYLLAEADGRLWVVDQHAAHERILYEELGARYRREPPVELSRPELLELTPDEVAAFEQRRTTLAAAGLALEPFGGSRWRVRTIPAFLAGIPDLIAEVVRGALAGGDGAEAWRRVLGRLACIPAIKAGHRLANAEAQALLDALGGCHTPWACPHGRPTALVLSELELSRRFGRSGVRNAPFGIENSTVTGS